MSTVESPNVSCRSLLSERAAVIGKLIDFLKSNRTAVIDVLTGCSSYAAARSELISSIRALEGALDEVDSLARSRSIATMAVFMPSNVLLYSYVLYLIIPSLYIGKIDFRPSSVVAEQAQALHEMLRPVHQLPITLQSVSQRVFIEEFLKPAQVILFTGAYVNAEKIRAQLDPDKQVLIFFGQGVNPVVVTETADLAKAAEDLVSIRLFNTGQDCMGPDVIFVRDTVAAPFLAMLRERLKALRFGPRKDQAADYSPIYYSSTIELISRFLLTNAKFIHHGGAIDYPQRKVEPTIVLGTLEEKPEIVEFFGPVFNVVSYADEAALKLELSKSFYRDRAMGASLYGSDSLLDFLSEHHSVSFNATLFDIEDGNKPFGGYGQMANYVFANRRLKSAPILVSQVISDFL